MTIAEKLTTVAENQQRVYDAGHGYGYEEGHHAGYELGNVNGWMDGRAEGYAEGIEQGKQAERDYFWDSYQQYGNRTNYICAFSGHGWTQDNCKPKYDMQPTNAYMMFRDNKFITNFPNWLAERGITIDFSKSTVMQYTFSSSTITEVGTVDCSSATSVYSLFDSCYSLKTIGKLIIADGAAIDYFLGSCSALENITIEGVLSKTFSIGSCSKLTHDSLMSIINALKDYSGSGTTYKLTLHATAKARLSTAEIAVATQKGWTIA